LPATKPYFWYHIQLLSLRLFSKKGVLTPPFPGLLQFASGMASLPSRLSAPLLTIHTTSTAAVSIAGTAYYLLSKLVMDGSSTLNAVKGQIIARTIDISGSGSLTASGVSGARAPTFATMGIYSSCHLAPLLMADCLVKCNITPGSIQRGNLCRYGKLCCCQHHCAVIWETIVV